MENYLILIAILITVVSTPLGSSFVFLFKKQINDKFKSIILGFAGGVMIAAAIFGLLLPAIEQSETLEIYKSWKFVPPIAGFIIGCFVIYILDKIIPHFHGLQNVHEGREAKNMSKNIKFFLAVTIHNIPEGLAVGFACGLALIVSKDQSLAAAYSALALAIGIGIQNVPEGAAVSIPLYGDGMKKSKSFMFGTLSGIVEPVFAVLGLLLSQLVVINPWLLAFASGAMIYVTLDEIMPETRENGFGHIGMWSFIIGFSVMMFLELILG